VLTTEFYLSYQGARTEQLDRFICIETGQCRVFMMADGFSQCRASPHYVDWLTIHLDQMNNSGKDIHTVRHDVSVLLQSADTSPGKASVACVIADDREYYYASLGDTRIYWLNRCERTRDHSLAERCALLGQCLPEAVRFHPLRNRLFAFAGNTRGKMHELNWHLIEYNYDHSLLLCTDGFWSQINDSDIYTIGSAKELKELCTRLYSGKNSSPDNITVALLQRQSGLSLQTAPGLLDAPHLNP